MDVWFWVTYSLLIDKRSKKFNTGIGSTDQGWISYIFCYISQYCHLLYVIVSLMLLVKTQERT